MLDDISQTAGDASPAVVVDEPVRLSGIAVLGSHPATVAEAPFSDPSWLIYACSPHNVEHRKLPRVNEWFECHVPIEDPSRAFSYLKAVSEMPLVWMRDERALKSGLFKGGRAYPEQALRGTSRIESIKVPTEQYRQVIGADGKPTMAQVMERRQAEIPQFDGKFNPCMFTSSIAFMLAKAIDDCEKNSIPAIGIYGVMQASENEYVYQRPGIQYFIGEAMKRGIKVRIPEQSRLFDMPQWKW